MDYTKYSDAKALESYNTQLDEMNRTSYQEYYLKDIIEDISTIVRFDTSWELIKYIAHKYEKSDTFYGVSAENLCEYDSRLRPYFIGLSGIRELTKIRIKG